MSTSVFHAFLSNEKHDGDQRCYTNKFSKSAVVWHWILKLLQPI